jgi:hypothetical protein
MAPPAPIRRPNRWRAQAVGGTTSTVALAGNAFITSAPAGRRRSSTITAGQLE